MTHTVCDTSLYIPETMTKNSSKPTTDRTIPPLNKGESTN
jgi:hypothetical protein